MSSTSVPRKRAPKPAPPAAPPAPSPPPAPAVSVLVPWRPTPERQRIWDAMRPRWESTGWQIVEGDRGAGAWSKGLAVADAARRADGEVLVVADADVWCDGIAVAVDAVTKGAPWAIPHYRVLRLTAPTTADVLATGEWPRRRTATTYAQPPYPGRPGGGIVVLHRDTYARVPLDPRFHGWGQEDEAWALALGTLAGSPWRGTEDLWHLWHAPQTRQSRTVGSAAGLALHQRYARARKDRARMVALVGEAIAAAALVPA